MTQTAFGTVAPTSRRAVAYIIDAAIAAGLGIVLIGVLFAVAFSVGIEGMLAVLAVGGPLVSLVLLAWFIVYTVMQSGKGSIGMRAQGLRLVRDADGAPLGFGRTLLRNIIFGISAVIIVGYFTPLFDGSGRFQGWHDKVAGSLMVDARGKGSASAAPATQAIHIPPRPPLPHTAPPIPNTAPPVPGLSAPRSNAVPPPYSAPLMPSLATPPVPNPGPRPATAYPAPSDLAPSNSAPDLDETVRGFEAPPSRPVPSTEPTTPIAQSATPAAGEETLIAFVPGITQDGPSTPAAPATPAPPAPAWTTPADPVPSSDDDLGDIEDTRISIPGHRLIFTWDDGTRVTVSRRTLFGRNPATEAGAVAVPVRDETLSLSKTHFEAASEPTGGWIMDRHSTNGTTIVRNGHRIVCTPGEQTPVRLGDAIEIGDRIVTVGGYA